MQEVNNVVNIEGMDNVQDNNINEYTSDSKLDKSERENGMELSTILVDASNIRSIRHVNETSNLHDDEKDEKHSLESTTVNSVQVKKMNSIKQKASNNIDIQDSKSSNDPLQPNLNNLVITDDNIVFNSKGSVPLDDDANVSISSISKKTTPPNASNSPREVESKNSTRKSTYNPNMMLPLKYQRKMLRDLCDSQKRNILIIGDRGLGLQETVLLAFLRQYSLQKQHLVLILNATSSQSNFLQLELNSNYSLNRLHPKTNSKSESKSLNNRVRNVKSLTSDNRRREYLCGGIIFVSSNVLVVDFLQNMIPIHLISGIVILNAHTVSDWSYETMAIRLFREKNEGGFVKALSDSPLGFTRSRGRKSADSGITKHLDKVMSLLCLNNLFLWPRFEEDVRNSLGDGPRTIEIEIEMTHLMKIIKSNIISLMKKAIVEIQTSHKEVDLGDDVTTACLLQLDYIVANQLHPVWNHVSRATKSLIEDLKELRQAALYLTQLDSVLYHNFLQNIKNDTTSNGIPKSDWVISKEAGIIFESARQRVYSTSTKKKVKRQRTMTQITSGEPDRVDIETNLTLNLETLPKWEQLELLLEEIQQGLKNVDQPEITNKVLIVTRSEKISSQISVVMRRGGKNYLKRCANRLINVKERETVKNIFKSPSTSNPQQKSPDNVRNRKRKKEEKPLGEETQEDIEGVKELLSEVIVIDDSEDEEDTIAIPTQDDVKRDFLENFSIMNDDDPSEQPNLDITIISTHTCENILNIFKPTFVICYDPDLEFSRRIEVFHAENPTTPLQVYFLRYIDSFDEQLFLSDCKTDHNAFISMIKSQSGLLSVKKSLKTLIAENRSQHDEEIQRSSRIAGGRIEQKKRSVVIVDSREFRSMLPIQLNQMGIDVIPRQLNVGDYILTKSICIERKALQDLIQSLNSGRLYNQVHNMMKRYPTSAVLIQFESHQAFSFSDEFADISLRLPTAKLVVLTIQFPHLKLLWSRSSGDTAELFQELKRFQEEPNENDIELVEKEEEDISDKAVNVLLQLPGVTDFNVHKITNNVTNLHELVNLSKEQMVELLGVVNGKKLYEFCNQ